jgi:WhiB family transcriptional regulator, redox-sensing transcriptional regulator
MGHLKTNIGIKSEIIAQPNPEYLTGIGVYATIPSNNDPDANWQDSARCLGLNPDLFYPENQTLAREAKEVCDGCPVRVECLEYAIEKGERFGVWGGLTERERRRLVHKRNEVARTAIDSVHQAEGIAV